MKEAVLLKFEDRAPFSMKNTEYPNGLNLLPLFDQSVNHAKLYLKMTFSFEKNDFSIQKNEDGLFEVLVVKIPENQFKVDEVVKTEMEAQELCDRVFCFFDQMAKRNNKGMENYVENLVEKNKIEKEKAESYFVNGVFDQDLEMVKNHLKTHETIDLFRNDLNFQDLDSFIITLSDLIENTEVIQDDKEYRIVNFPDLNLCMEYYLGFDAEMTIFLLK